MNGLTVLVECLPSAMNEAGNELEEAKRTIRRLEKELKKLQYSPGQRKVRVGRKDGPDYQQQILDLQKQFNAEKEKHRQTAEAAHQEIFRLFQENKELKEDVSNLSLEIENRASFGDAHATRNVVGNEKDMSTYLVGENLGNGTDIEHENIRLIERISELKEKNKKYKEIIKELKKDVKSTQSCTELKTQYADEVLHLQHELAETQFLNDNLLKKIKKAESSVVVYKQELQHTKELLKNTGAARANNTHNTTNLSAEVSGYKDEITHLSHQLEIALETIKLEKEKNRNLKEETQNLITKLQGEIHEKHREIADFEEGLGSANYCRELERRLKDANLETKSLRRELEEVKTRLSQLMGQKLTDNNPNIADLSDKNRPTKLAERYSELYDNQWTDAFEVIFSGDEKETVATLLRLLYHIMDFCKYEAAVQMKRLKTVLGHNEALLPDSAIKHLKDSRKIAADIYGKELLMKYFKELKYSKSTASIAATASKMRPFVEECFSICWLMCIQDPPVVLSPDVQHGQRFNADLYKAYTKSGSCVDFLVWPAMFLHEGGPILCKGVAQGVPTKVVKQM